MKNAYWIAIGLAGLVWTLPGIGQPKQVAAGNQQWLHYFGRVDLSEKWSWFNDGGFRFKEGFGQKSQYLVRTAISYHLHPQLRLGIGAGHWGTYSSGKLDQLEYRPHQELHLSQEVGKTIIGHRLRVEERWFARIGNGSDANPFSFRFRYRLQLRLSLFPISASTPDRKVILALSDELFINAGKHIVYNFFDQNRIMATLLTPSAITSSWG